MKVSITKIITRNLRCPDLEILFDDKSNGSGVNLIQMPNGTGKTTIIELLEGVLTQKAEDWRGDEVSNFKNTTTNPENGEFILSLKLAYPNKKNHELSLNLSFDFLSNTVQTTTDSKEYGFSQGWTIPKELAPFLQEKCVEVFVFKGDKTEDIVTQGIGDAQPSIKAFFGLSTIAKLVEENSLFYKNKLRQLEIPTNITNKQNFEKKKNLLQAWNGRLELITTKHKEIKEALEQVVAKKNVLKNELGQLISSSGKSEEETKFTKKIEDLNEQSSAKMNEIMALYRDPFSFSSNISDSFTNLKNTLDDLQLPGTSRSFFENYLKKHDHCLCGTELDEEKVHNIKTNISHFLTDKDIGIIESIKNEGDSEDDNSAEIDSLTKELNQLIDQLEQAREKYKNFQASIDMDKINRLTELTTDEAKYVTAKNNIEKEITFEDINKPDNCTNVNACNLAIEKLEGDLDKIGDIKDIAKAHKLFDDVVQRTLTLAHDGLKEQLVTKINEKLKKYLRPGSEIEVLNIDKNIQLGWNNQTKEKGSGAQNSITIYSFATSILERADIGFPLIVDHPVTNMDLPSRKHVGEKLSEISHQFIGFIIDSEKPSFLSALESFDKPKYISIFQKIEGNQSYIDDLNNQPDDMKYISDNGCICYDKEFFHKDQEGIQ